MILFACIVLASSLFGVIWAIFELEYAAHGGHSAFMEDD